MDPNKLGQLDPKLKEAYDRVMNAAATPPPPPPSAPSQTAQTSPSPTAPPPPPPASNVTRPFLQNTPPPDIAPSPVSKPAPDHVEVTQTPGPIASKFPAYKAGTLKAHRGGNVPTILWVLLAAVFFVAYTLIWVRVLGVSLPFLP